MPTFHCWHFCLTMHIYCSYSWDMLYISLLTLKNESTKNGRKFWKICILKKNSHSISSKKELKTNSQMITFWIKLMSISLFVCTMPLVPLTVKLGEKSNLAFNPFYIFWVVITYTFHFHIQITKNVKHECICYIYVCVYFNANEIRFTYMYLYEISYGNMNSVSSK